MGCIHLDGIIDDPVKIWEKLAIVHVSKKPGTRFNAYDDFFSIRKKEDESLQSLMTRIDKGMHQIQNLRPTGFSLSELDDELTCMAMIRALPDQYAHFTSSLLLLGTLDKTQLRDAFLAEEVNRRRRAQVDSALHSSSTTANSTCTHPNCHHCNQSTTSTRIQCDFCGLLGHTQDKCHRYIISRQQAVEGAKNRYKRGNKAQAGSSNSQNTSQQPKSSPNNANSSTV
ncbi:hypothetical protein SERLA73DRAFT_80703, partial [Serpula lacrymans var. lacrymans S7.3]